MKLAGHHRANWKALFAERGFRHLFAAILISMFGSGMSFAGVTWYVLEQTQSTVQVSLVVILVTLPGLIIPTFSGVLIDRVDRRYLAMGLDLGRASIVLGTAALMYFARGGLWQIYTMVLLVGVGFAVYWSTANALVQEVVPHEQFVAANAGVLIAVQSGMMTAGAVVGFIYEYAGIGGILAIDGATYLVSALCLSQMRRGSFPPRHHLPTRSELIESTELLTSEQSAMPPPMLEPSFVQSFLADLKEGLRYLRQQPRVFALGLTYACMMAGVISANVLVVALARDILQAGPRGFGYMEAGWAVGAIVGGLATGMAATRTKPLQVLIVALATLAVGHAVLPYVHYLALAVAMNAVFGSCRALGGVLTQSSIMSLVPRRLMGRTQSAFSLISTLLQVAMSFSLGWVAERTSLAVAFAVLGLLYAIAVVAALRTRHR